MVLALDSASPSNATGTFGWSVNGSAENSLWYFRGYLRTDQYLSELHDKSLHWKYVGRPTGFGEEERKELRIRFDALTFTVLNNVLMSRVAADGSAGPGGLSAREPNDWTIYLPCFSKFSPDTIADCWC